MIGTKAIKPEALGRLALLVILAAMFSLVIGCAAAEERDDDCARQPLEQLQTLSGEPRQAAACSPVPPRIDADSATDDIPADNTPEEEPHIDLTTDTRSSEFDDIDEKLAFLARYTDSSSEVIDAEYHIVFSDGYAYGAPSSWDIRAAMKVTATGYIRLTRDLTEVSQFQGFGAIELSWWDGLASDDLTWDLEIQNPEWRRGARLYRNDDGSKYIVYFHDSQYLLSAYSLEPV